MTWMLFDSDPSRGLARLCSNIEHALQLVGQCSCDFANLEVAEKASFSLLLEVCMEELQQELHRSHKEGIE